MAQKEIRVYFREIVNEEIIFKTNASALLHLLVILIAVAILPVTIMLNVEGSNDPKVWVVEGICLVALIGIIFVPVQGKYKFNLAQRNLQFSKTFLTTKLGFPKEKVSDYSILPDGISFGESKFRKKGILIKTDKGELFLLVQYPKYDLGVIQHKVESYFGLAVEPELESESLPASIPGAQQGGLTAGGEGAPEVSPELGLLVIKHKMLEQIKSWGVTLIILGGLHLIESHFLSFSWGLVLLVVGLGSFIFKSSAMFIVYAMSLIWAAIHNFTSANFGGWTLFALFQIYLAYSVFRKYRVFHGNEQLLNEKKGKDAQYISSEKWFPVAGLLVGGGALTLYLVFFAYILYAIAVSLNIDAQATFLNISFDVLSGLGMIGFSVSVASIVAKYKRKWLAWIGLTMSGLLLMLHFYIILR